jgi:nucleotide-binding universal stress UspA family protein
VFATILVPLDGSPHTEVAIAPAFALATQARVRMVLMSVTDAVHASVRRTYLHTHDPFVPSYAEVVVAEDVAPAIVSCAHAHAPALVCMASHGRSAVGQALFGSTSAKVIHDIGGPVLAVGPHCAPMANYSEVLIAVDDSKDSAAVVPAAVQLAEQIDAKLQIVQVVDPTALRQAREAGIDPSDVRETGHVAKLATELAHQGVVAGWEVLHDRDPAHGIVDYLLEKPNAIVALATHARSGFSLLSHHGVANHVVHRSANPVLLLH